MRVALVALILGLLSIALLPSLPSVTICILLASGGFLLIYGRIYPVGLLLIGIAWGSFCALQTMSDRLDPLLDGKTLWIEGIVTGLPEQTAQVVRFQLTHNQATATKLPSHIRLSWYKGERVITGERWRLLVRLKYPRGTVNPDSFDYEAWLTAKHIGATGTVKQAVRLTPAQGLATWRYALREKILATSSAGQSGSLVALILGDGSGISQAQWRILQETGTVHLMVISGQHITLLAGFLYLLVAWLFRRGLWPKQLPWLPCACGLAMFGALAYGLLAGFDIPVQRACIMLALVLIWRLRFRHLGVVMPFLAALALVLVCDPLASLQAGFWLSFASVAILLLGFSGRLSHSNWWLNAIKVEWLITIGLIPWLMLLLLPVSLTSPVANIIAVPVVSLIIIPLALLGVLLIGVPYLGSGLLWLAGYALQWLFWVLALIAQIIPAWVAPMAPWWAFVLACLGVILLLLPRGVPLRVFGIVFCLPLFFPHQPNIAKGQANIMVFDVGQGLSVLVRTTQHILLYDTGPSFGDFNLADRMIIPALKRQGITKLDKLIVSHADTDHAGGLQPISQQLMVKELISGEPQKLTSVLPINNCQTGKEWLWDGVKFSLWQWQEAKNGNDASCVLLIEAQGERLLLTGDISSKAEQAWLTDHPITIDWLLAPHHGSKNSSSQHLLVVTRPTNIVISRGWLNTFKHPSPLVLARYKAVAAKVEDTALAGALQIKLGQYLPATRQRDVKYFWRKE